MKSGTLVGSWRSVRFLQERPPASHISGFLRGGGILLGRIPAHETMVSDRSRYLGRRQLSQASLNPLVPRALPENLIFHKIDNG